MLPIKPIPWLLVSTLALSLTAAALGSQASHLEEVHSWRSQRLLATSDAEQPAWTKEVPTLLETLATWFSGLVYLNPSFGGRDVNPRDEWEQTPSLSTKNPPATVPGEGSAAALTTTTGTSDAVNSRPPREQEWRSLPVAKEVLGLGADAELPKVALMFLTRGDMPYEATWLRFLEGSPLKGSTAGAGWEMMFTLYVHPGINYTYPEHSLFFGRAIKDRAAVEWGQWGVMQAERNLIAAALEDDLNDRFVLLSESCIPLYPAALVWAQLLSEPRSRIHACANLSDPNDANRRMTYRMQNMERDGLKAEHWRKSGQWISLNRKHAELVADDSTISNLFEKECWVDAEHLSKGEPLWRFCVSDEHYIPTLLAYHGLEEETDCQGSVTNAWWDGPYFHPRTWEAADVSLELISKLRKTNNGFSPQDELVCPSDEVLRSVHRIFAAIAPTPEKPRSRLSKFLGRAGRRKLLQSSQPADGSINGVADRDPALLQDAGRPQNRQTASGEVQPMPARGGEQRGQGAQHSAGAKVMGARAELEHGWGGNPVWMHVAVLQPGCLEWWQAMDTLGINGDDILAAMAASSVQPGASDQQLGIWKGVPSPHQEGTACNQTMEGAHRGVQSLCRGAEVKKEARRLLAELDPAQGIRNTGEGLHWKTTRRLLAESEAVERLLKTEEGLHWEAARPLLAQFTPMVDGGCPLFARKFAAPAAGSVADLAGQYVSLSAP